MTFSVCALRRTDSQHHCQSSAVHLLMDEFRIKGEAWSVNSRYKFTSEINTLGITVNKSLCITLNLLK